MYFILRLPSLFVTLTFAFSQSSAFGQVSTNDVVVANLEGLYAAVNNPINENATLWLQPGTYILTPIDPNGQPRVNGGSLFLKAGMTLQGQNEYVDHDGDGVFDARDTSGDVYADPQTETIIDGALLNVIEQGIVPGPIVVAGPIDVSIRGLTVRAGPRGQAAIDVRAPGSDFSQVAVQECILERGRRGVLLDATNRWGSDNAEVHLRAERNIIRDHVIPGISFGWGIQAMPVNNTGGAHLSLHVQGNRFTGNKVGLLLELSAISDSEIIAVSIGNIYEDAVLTQIAPVGNVFAAGIFMAVRGDNNQFGHQTNRNHIRLVSQDDRIWNNAGFAGLYVEGARRLRNDTEILDNRIDVQLLGTRFVKLDEFGEFDGSQNQDARSLSGLETPVRRDILIVGANHSNNNNVFPPPEGFSGISTGNQVNLLMRWTKSSSMPIDYDLEPQPLLILDNEPDEVKITLSGSAAFVRTNTGWEF